MRAFHPAARTIDLRLAADRRAAADDQARAPAGLFEAVVEPEPNAAILGARLPPPPHVSRRSRHRDRRSVSVRPGPERFRSPPVRRRARTFAIFEKLGAHRITIGSTTGVHFAVWAPNADRVSVIGDFNGWDGRVHAMRLLVPAGVWEIFIPDLPDGEKYKFEIRTRSGRAAAEERSVRRRVRGAAALGVDRPRHLGLRRGATRRGWRRGASAARGSIGRCRSTKCTSARGRACPRTATAFSPIASWRTGWCPTSKETGFTHIELLPVMEHPFSGSWGYQVLGFFAPTSRFGPPEDFKYFVDACHQAGLGVILDWVPGHFPKDEHGLARFDGTALYEHADPRQGEHQDWGTLIFNYGRNEVRNFLLSNALFWLEEYHVDGLRVDAVASMLYLDYSRREGEWIPNQYGGRENLEAISFLQQLNTLTHGEYPGTITAAEESTSWPGVSRPVHLGGLGFTYKWNMGWMHDMLAVRARGSGPPPLASQPRHLLDAVRLHRELHPAVLARRSGARQGRRCSTRCRATRGRSTRRCARCTATCSAHPGKKLLFMGSEFGQWREWNHDHSLDWHLLDDPSHAALRRYVQDLNAHLPRRAVAVRVRLRPDRLPLDRLQRQREQRRVDRPLRARSPRLPRAGVQLHAGAARRLPHRRARARLLCRAAEQRRRDLRRQQRRQRRRRLVRARRRRTGSISRCASRSRRSDASI